MSAPETIPERLPERALVLIGKIEADSRRAMADKLNDLAQAIEHEGLEGRTIGGGPGAGHIAHLRANGGMKHDRYFLALNAWLTKDRLGDWDRLMPPPVEALGDGKIERLSKLVDARCPLSAEQTAELELLTRECLPSLLTAYEVNEGLWREIDQAKAISGYDAYWEGCRSAGTGGFTFAGYLRHMARRLAAPDAPLELPRIKPGRDDEVRATPMEGDSQ